MLISSGMLLRGETMFNMYVLHQLILGPLKTRFDWLGCPFLKKKCSDPSNPQVHISLDMMLPEKTRSDIPNAQYYISMVYRAPVVSLEATKAPVVSLEATKAPVVSLVVPGCRRLTRDSRIPAHFLVIFLQKNCKNRFFGLLGPT